MKNNSDPSFLAAWNAPGAAGVLCLVLLGCNGDSTQETTQPWRNETVRSGDQLDPERMQTLEENLATAPSGTLQKTHDVTDQAITLLRAGDVVEANQLIRQHLDDVSEEYGEYSSPSAWAHYEMSLVYVMAGQQAMREGTRSDAYDLARERVSAPR